MRLHIFPMFLSSKYVSGVISSNPEIMVSVAHLRIDVISLLDSPV